MNRTAVRLGKSFSKAAGLAALALMGGALASGCRSSGVTVDTGISPTDDHGNTVFDATVVIPDGSNVSGQINIPGDVDWFKFRGIQGVGYALQISGFPTDPNVNPAYDLNNNGRGFGDLKEQIISPDGVTQLVNSSGSQGGAAVDIQPAGFRTTGVGDSRIFWICPTTDDYYIVMAHRRNGIGAYRFRLATSQLTTILNPSELDDSNYQTGGRHVVLPTSATDPTPVFVGDIFGGIWWPRVEFIESLGSTDISDIAVLISQFIIPVGSTTPLAPHLHAHVGYPNVFFPEASRNITDNGTTVPHATIFDVALPTARSFDTTAGPVTAEGTITMADGSQARFPATIEQADNSGQTRASGEFYKLTLHLGAAVSDSPRALTFSFTPQLFRTLTGWPWYFDLHPQPDMTLDSKPITASRPLADMYHMFETPLDAQAANVILRDGSRLPASRGTTGFNIFYDSSLKVFQVQTEIYSVEFSGGIIEPDYQAFVGDRVKVWKGTPGTVDTSPTPLIDLGTMPPLRPPRTANPPFSTNTIPEPAGFKQPIRQLTDSEALKLRDAFYNGGFYVEVTDQFSGAPLVRAEGNLDISFFSTLPLCGTPGCRDTEPVQPPQKGTVTFALGAAGLGPVDLYANGELLGTLRDPVSPDSLPACGFTGDNRTLATDLWPETYYWHAHTKDGKKIDGHVTVTGGACQIVLVK